MASPTLVLIVAQDQAISDLLVRVVGLVYPSATIVAVPDSTAAWQAYGQHGADLAVVEEPQPAGDVWDLLQRLRSSDATLPILLLTWEHGLLARALGAGVTQVLEPPIDVPRVMDTLRQLLPP
jgi:CheY-like chemotaxis protein